MGYTQSPTLVRLNFLFTVSLHFTTSIHISTRTGTRTGTGTGTRTCTCTSICVDCPIPYTPQIYKYVQNINYPIPTTPLNIQ